jgi:DNA anti-recombination protein RmuC
MAAEDQTTEPTNTAQLKAVFEHHLEEAKQRLEQAKQDLAGVRASDKESIRQKSAEIRQRVHDQEQRANELRDEAASWLKDKKAHSEEQISSWRQRRELKHLERRADRAEEYAVNALVVAMLDADEAEIAALDALDARLDADQAIGSIP